MSGEEEIGTLIVVVFKAQHLKDDHFYKQDVYSTVKINGVTRKTKIDFKGGQHPMWDEEIRFPVMGSTAPKYRQLEVACWAKEHKDDPLLGEGSVDITATLKSGEFDEWVPLKVNDTQRGELYLEITYYSKAPPPPSSGSKLAVPAVNLGRRPSKLSPAERLYRPTSSTQNLAPRTPPKDNYLPMPGSYPTTVPSTLKPGSAAVKTGTTPPQNELRPGPMRVSPKQQQQHLPGSGAAVKPTLHSEVRPGPTRVSPKQQQQPLPGVGQSGHVPQKSSAAPIPSILRPGNPESDPRPAQRSSSSSPSRSHGPAPSAYPNPYDTAAPAATYNPSGSIPFASSASVPHSNMPQTSSTPAPAATYNPSGSIPFASSASVPHSNIPQTSSTPAPGPDYRQNSYQTNAPYTHVHRQSSNPSILDWNSTQPQAVGGSISFPVPNFSGPASSPAAGPQIPPSANASYGRGTGFYTPYGQTPPPVHQRTTSFTPQSSRTLSGSPVEDLPDPYLIARYQTPLPLPPGSSAGGSSPPSSHRHPRTSSAGSSSYSHKPPPPIPPLPGDSSRPSHSASPSPTFGLDIPTGEVPVRSRTPIDDSRLKALRQAEEEAARRREQEERDAELARQLDLEEAEREERERRPAREHKVKATNEIPDSTPPKTRRSASPKPPSYANVEAARKAQEEKDAEIARQLDKELNLDG